MNYSLIDLSHTIENGLITYKGLPAPVICDFLSRENSKKLYADRVTFQIGKIEMVANTGTYIDCPFHRYENGKDTSELGLEYFADLEAICIQLPYHDFPAVSAQHLQAYEVENKAVLISTGWDKFWNTDRYYEGHPFLTEDAAEFLKTSGAKLVGIDSHNIDDVADKSRPVHSILLGAGILIVEHLCNMGSLPKENFLFSAVPPKIKGIGTFPVRAMVKIPNQS